MGCLKGYVQRSLTFRPSLYEKLVKRAEADGCPNYTVVESAFNAAFQQGHIKRRIVKSVVGRKASIADSYKYIPVYVKEEVYRLVKGTAVIAGVPMYLLIEEIIARHILRRKAYDRYVQKHFPKGT